MEGDNKLVTKSVGPEDTHIKRDYEFTDDYCVIVSVISIFYTFRLFFFCNTIPPSIMKKYFHNFLRTVWKSLFTHVSKNKARRIIKYHITYYNIPS